MVIRSSIFAYNRAKHDSGGAIYSNAYTTVEVVGQGNRFESNACNSYGGVFGATSNTTIVVEGGEFFDSYSDEVSACTKMQGRLASVGGLFGLHCPT